MRTTVEGEAKERYLALSFILALDKNRYGSLIRSLKNAYQAKRDEWLKSLVDALERVQSWMPDCNPQEDKGKAKQEAGGAQSKVDKLGESVAEMKMKLAVLEKENKSLKHKLYSDVKPTLKKLKEKL